jgi:hypothetical protein
MDGRRWAARANASLVVSARNFSWESLKSWVVKLCNVINTRVYETHMSRTRYINCAAYKLSAVRSTWSNWNQTKLAHFVRIQYCAPSQSSCIEILSLPVMWLCLLSNCRWISVLIRENKERCNANLWVHKFSLVYTEFFLTSVKVKQPRYRPGVAQRVPGS